MSLAKLKSFSVKNSAKHLAVVLAIGVFALGFHLTKTHALTSGPFALVSSGNQGEVPQLIGGFGVVASISGDGSLAAAQIASGMSNYLFGVQENSIGVKNLITNQWEIVSKNSAGVAANGNSRYPVISRNGRYVVFDSSATNMTPGVNSSWFKIFVHDRQTGELEWISQSQNDGDINTHASLPTISSDGRYVAYRSASRDIVPYSSTPRQQIFIHDRQTGSSEIITQSSDGVLANAQSTERASISADGIYVVFQSNATNLSPLDTNNNTDIYIRDRESQTTELVSKNSLGLPGNGVSRSASISANGRYVVFSSTATNLVAGYVIQGENIYIYDRVEDSMSLVNINDQGSLLESSTNPVVSANGRYIAFTATMGNADLRYIRDMQSSSSTLVTVSIDGSYPEIGSFQWPYSNSISDDGRFLGFVTNGAPSIFEGFNRSTAYLLYDRDYDANDGGEDPTDPTENTICSNESTDTSLVVGGYGWMGANIEAGSAQSQGGGGWLKLGCEDGEQNWGARVNFNPGSSNYGKISGNAWSNNYGWLSFEEDVVSSCWENAPSETASSTARILLADSGENVPVVGWAKFINGDDFDDDGYNGCVSFSGTNYGTRLNLETGALTGWAWGSDVIGWLSFQNSVCPFCDAEVDLPEEELIICEDPLAINNGEEGECQYGGDVEGCMDSDANNYNASATIQPAGACTYDDDPDGGGGRPTLNLNVTPNSFTIGVPNQLGQFVATDISWTSNEPGEIDSCVGSFGVVSGGITQTSTLGGWTGIRAVPNSSLENIVVPQAASVTNAGTQLVFTITCETDDGETLIATDNILFTAGPTSTATLDLRIESPNSNPQGNDSFQILNASSGAMVALVWESEDIQPDSCVATSTMTPSTLGSNEEWDGDVADEGSTLINMLIGSGSINNGVSTQFRITCNELNGFDEISDVVNVCIADTLCPVTQSGLFPSYQEF